MYATTEPHDDQHAADAQAMGLLEYTEILQEIETQPPWRSTADREMDFADGNQLDSDLLARQKAQGIPPAVEDLIGPAIRSLAGYEASTRTDWRVTPDAGPDGQDVADALNYKLNQAEKKSGADTACGDAFVKQAAVGVGFVEVSRQGDPFRYPYRCQAVHRNEIHWDMSAAPEDYLLDHARWLRRARWLRPERVIAAFPQHKALIQACGKHGASWWAETAGMQTIDGGGSTGLSRHWHDARGWTVEEARWFDPHRKEIMLSELWYRRWVNVPVLIDPFTNAAVEFDEGNEEHLRRAAAGTHKVVLANAARVRRAFWLGPHCLHDGPTPYAHAYFPYVPFFAFREDRTGVPYGYVRGMIYQQESINSGTAKLRWGLSAVRTERTNGAVAMSDGQFRQMIARPDADVVLDAEHMALPGARFEVKRDFQLNAQQLQLINDARAAIERTSSVTAGFLGRQGSAQSGLQEQTQVEQSNQALATLMSRFRAARSRVGEILLSLIVQDIGSRQEEVVIEGNAVAPDRTIVLNAPEQDEHGRTYLSNDLMRTLLKVALEEVPSSTSYRGQQLNAMSEAVKSLPAQYQAAVLPFMVSLMDVPFKREVVEAVRGAAMQQTPEEVEKRIKEEVQKALMLAGHELKQRELDMKERKTDAEIKQIMAQAVQIGVQAAFSAMQAGAQVAQMPQIAPVADSIMAGAGYKKPDPMGDDPNFPVPAVAMPPEAAAPDVRKNTSPAFPPVPNDGTSPMTGIETPTTADNLAGADA